MCYLDLSLDIFNGVAGLHLEGDRLTRKGLDEDLHDGRVLLLKCEKFNIKYEDENETEENMD